MDAKRLTGIKASALKYDLLTALSVTGLHAGPRHQIALSRLMLLITARYNWRLDEFCAGQRDLARMWNVTERTVKREIRYWQEQQLIICKRQGVRGRVGAYRLNYAEVYRQSQPFWAAIGPDFQERMAETHPVQGPKVVAVDFRKKDAPPDASTTATTGPPTWRAACQRMCDLQPAHYQNWLSQLQFVADEGQLIRLRTSNQFVAHYIQTHLLGVVMEAIEATLGPRKRIQIDVEQ